MQHETPEQATERTRSTPVVAGQGVVEVTADERGFTPGHIQVKQGQKTTLRFKRTSDKTCATAVVFPELEIKKDLPLGQPVDIQVPTGQKRTFGFQCGMGMYKSSVVIVGS
jgi:plastocyanin domain-containing protein